MDSAEAEFIGEVDVPSFQPGNSEVVGLQVDAGGRFWIINSSMVDPDGAQGEIDEANWVYLSSFTLDDFEAIEAGLLWDAPFYSEALLFLPTLAAGPTLAATGVEPGVVGAGGAAALLLLLGGAGLLAARRRTATR